MFFFHHAAMLHGSFDAQTETLCMDPSCTFLGEKVFLNTLTVVLRANVMLKVCSRVVGVCEGGVQGVDSDRGRSCKALFTKFELY